MKAEDLLDAVRHVMPGVDQGLALAEGADLITFEGRWVRSYDGTLGISYPLETGLSCNVPGKPLYGLLTRLGSGNVRLDLEDGKFILKGQGKQLTLQVWERELESVLLDLSGVEFLPVPPDFVDGMGLCSFSVSKDPTLGILTGMFVGGDLLLATDNYRISRYRMKEEVAGSMTIPLECIAYLMRMGGAVEVSVSAPHWVHFKGKDGVVVSSRLVGGEYKRDEILKILDVSRVGDYSFPEGTLDAFARAEVLSAEDPLRNPFIELRRKGEFLIVRGERKEVGEYEERLKWDSDFPEDCSLQMNPDFLSRVLRITRGFSLDEEKKLVVFSSEDGSFEHLEMARMG